LEHVLGAPELTIRKIRPALYHSTLRSVLTLDKFVFTHGFINITFNIALLICNTSEKYLKTTGVSMISILSWRKRVNHTARNLTGSVEETNCRLYNKSPVGNVFSVSGLRWRLGSGLNLAVARLVTTQAVVRGRTDWSCKSCLSIYPSMHDVTVEISLLPRILIG